MLSAKLICSECGWQTTCGEAEVARRLRTLGLLRRAAHPPAEVVRELLLNNVTRLVCDQCAKPGLLLGDSDADDDWDDWHQAVICEVCRQPIPPERVEVFPDARRCVACQDVADRGEEPAELEFCKKCGSLVELRVSRGGGITRYKRFCTGDPPCRL